MRTFLLCSLLASMLPSNEARADARTDVHQTFAKVLDAGGFRGQVWGSVFGPGTPAVSGEIDALFPDRIHLRGEELEYVVTADGAWIRALGYWTPADRSLLPITTFDLASMRTAIASISEAIDEGTAKSSSCEHLRIYAFNASGQLPGTVSNGKVRLWVCQANGLPSRIEAIGSSDQSVIIDFDWSRQPRVVAPID